MKLSSSSKCLQLLDTFLADGLLGKLKAPSISAAGSILYMRGPLEASYQQNLKKRLCELLDRMPSDEECATVIVTDPTLPTPVKVRLVKGDVNMGSGFL
jgi:hypothetical protein